MKPRRDKTQRLMLAADEGHKLSRFINDPLILRIFEDLEDNAIEAMIEAGSPADREREALRIKVIRSVLSDLQNVAKQGERATQDLQKIDGVKHAT